MSLCVASDVADHEVLSQARERVCIDMVDLGPPDPDQTHMTNSRPLISLVRSNCQNFISQLANRGVIRDCL